MRSPRRWLLERLVEAEAFEHCLKPGSRPNCCAGATGSLVVRSVACPRGLFRCVEFDLVTVEDDVVFGSLVRLAPRADAHLNGKAERIVVRREQCADTR